MNHHTSDISKELRSNKNIKTKSNFLFTFNNFKRENGSIGTILTAEGSSPKPVNVKRFLGNNSSLKKITSVKKFKPKEHLKNNKEFQQCVVKIKRLSETEIESHRSMPVLLHNNKKSEMSPAKDQKLVNKTKKVRNLSTNKHSNRVANDVDKDKLHLELEKAVSTFASDDGQRRDYLGASSNYFSTINVDTPRSYKRNSKNAPIEREDSTSRYKFWHLDALDFNDLRSEQSSNPNKTKTARVSSSTRNGRRKDSGFSDTDEEEEWQGWNSNVTPVVSIPGAEIVSVETKGLVEHSINLNSRVESDSDLDVEEVLLLTDLEKIKETGSRSQDNFETSDDEWFGWPEHESSVSLGYVFNV